MKVDDLRKWIDSLTQDIDFTYQGKKGSICPFTKNDISLCFDRKSIDVNSVDEALLVPFIDGRSLSELCEQLDF